jgi:hypothetical protein
VGESAPASSNGGTMRPRAVDCTTLQPDEHSNSLVSIAAVIVQQRPISVSLLLGDLAVGLFLAWVISSGHNRWWMISRAPWWPAHVWLSRHCRDKAHEHIHGCAEL